MDRRLAWALVPLPGILLVWALHATHTRLDAEARARVDDTLGIGDVVLGAPPPPGFVQRGARGIMHVMVGRVRWDAPPHPTLDGAFQIGWHPQLGAFRVARRSPEAPDHLPTWLAMIEDARHVHGGGDRADEAVAELLALVRETAEREGL